MTRNLLLRWADFLATGFYSGYSPKAPGTCGTAAAVLLLAACATLNPRIGDPVPMAILASVTFLLGTLIADKLIRADFYQSGAKDPQSIVIDEFAGLFVTLIGHPLNWPNLLIAFFAFRFFDITKLPPIRRLEKFPGGLGVMLDDVLAGLYANLLMRVVFAFVTIG